MTCRSSEGGSPNCPRAANCKTVELRGRSLSSIDQFRQRITNTTTAEGGPYKIVFVADYPDRWDNNNSFIGHARALDKVIELCKRANIDLNEAYFTYLTRCFTFKKPSIQEIKACTPYTVDDIERLQPEVVVLLGTAAQRLFNLQSEGGVTKLRGKHFTLPLPGRDPEKTYSVVATYDPAIFFHRSDVYLEQRILDDYRMIHKLADKKEIAEKNQYARYEVLKTLESVREFIAEVKTRRFFAFDTESRGLPWTKEPMILISFCIGEGENYVLPMYHHTEEEINGWHLRKAWSERAKYEVIIPLLKEIFENENIHKAAHNIKYDSNVLRKHLGIRIKGYIYDTMLMHHLLNEQKPHDLEYLMDLEFGTGNYCLVPGTKVLRENLSWDNIENIKPGDKLFSVEEYPENRKKRRKLKTGEVLDVSNQTLECVEISLSDGRKLTCSLFHKWMVRKKNHVKWKWIEARNIPLGWQMLDITSNTWEEDLSKEAGYLAGIFDGEGCICKWKVSVAQKQNNALEEMKNILSSKGYKFGHMKHNKSGVHVLYISNIENALRFLGSVRPKRLIYSKFWDGLTTAYPGRNFPIIVSVKNVGVLPTIGLKTSTSTFVAEGIISHNSHKVEAIVGKGKVLKQQYDTIPDDILYEYTATDVEGTFKLCKAYKQRLMEQLHLWSLYWEETAQLSKILGDAEWYGHAVNMDTHAALVKSYTDDAAILLKDIHAETWVDFNPNSSPDVQKAVIDAGFEEAIRDKKNMNGYSTGREKLMGLENQLPIAAKILRYRNTQKMLGTYLENVTHDVDSDGRIRYNFFIHGTESGRLSNRFLHQMPRVDKKRTLNMRDMLVAEKGYKLVFFDYDQIEMRVLTELSGDKELAKIFCFPQKETIDVHKSTASTVLDIPYEKISEFNRQEVGKSVNFGLAYGSEGHRLVAKCQWEDTFGARHPIDWPMLNRGMERFKSRYTSLTEFLDIQPDIARRLGNKLTTPFGRERRIGGKLADPIEGVRKAAEREIVNFVIQSTAVAITFRSLIILDGIIRDWVYRGIVQEGDIRLVNTVHDSGTYEVKDQFVDMWIDVLKKVLPRPIPELGERQFPCAIGIGLTATRAEKDKIAQ